MASKTLTAACLCKAVHYTLTLPTDQLPLKVHLCSCTVCRRTHGAPCSFHAPLPSGIAPEFIAPSSIDNLTAYVHPNALSARFFCTTCGCHIGDRDLDNKDWFISTALFDANSNEGWYEIQSHAFTHSTRDGGISSLLPMVNGRDIEIWNPDPESKESLPTESNELLAECHCGGVSFTISRPRKEYINSPSSKKWIDPSDTSKWLALVDVCSDCRLVTGSNVIMWMFVPTDHITPRPPADLLFGSLKAYESSEGVWRTFCGTCGTTVFYSHKTRPGIVDVATGILHAPEGVMLNNWAVWRTARVGFVEDGLQYDSRFTRGLEEGLREWGVRMHGQSRDFAVGAETHDDVDD
ncbi:hypothetical protein ASPVEDRAFT_194589 [Aspergillus versicolor CBS 583.65]|uniref:CENP-V/GFA domain-containing protein n=1 Tax=Aspergillus versicolor CBS 583.65 TaxID=1036611 RepID=A0A1L9PNQ6_ASPVE|nr:uncharacterized protein ASPVEDRAFT_194589 [Aspergillus versicolor CBS 583.65]OJJ03158.1 hypothetical protein ASPVEDRAFT_194589 [Aspergillus versicolor CBS 583.65]